MKLWAHQERAIEDLRACVVAGKKRICLVSPVGSGKGTIAAEILKQAVARGNRGVFLVHRREIILDIVSRLQQRGIRAGAILPGHNASPYAQVQVCSIQTLLNRSEVPPAEVVIWDETHHAPSDSWSKLFERYPNAIIIGMTASPERGDGRPLSQFEHMIVAAQYSELIRDGRIVVAKVFQPSVHQGRDLACDPVEAFKKYAPLSKGFCFVNSIELAEDVARRFRETGVPAVCVTGKTTKHIRDRAVSDLTRGSVRVLVNYNVFGEGTDVASADLCIIARQCAHPGTYIQIAGRVLRASPGKAHAIILDLVGASISHGLPTADREYSLDGKAIGLSNLPPLTVCASCGLTQLSGRTTCEGCGFIFIRKERRRPYIDSQELRAVYDFENTPETAKLDYFLKLIDLISVDGYDRIAGRYRDLFGADPPLEWRAAIPTEIKKHAFEIWKKQAEEKGWKRGYAFARYIESFGSAP